MESAHVFGDAALLDWVETRVPPAAGPSLLLFDAPLVCPNATGSRPVDRLTTSRFGRFHAGPHPANAGRCVRPLRLARAVSEARGGVIGWQLGSAERLLAEVFPHPATIRLLGLERIVKYKRGPVAARRSGVCPFARAMLRTFLQTRFASWRVAGNAHANRRARCPVDEAGRGPARRVRVRADRLLALAATRNAAAKCSAIWKPGSSWCRRRTKRLSHRRDRLRPQLDAHVRRRD